MVNIMINGDFSDWNMTSLTTILGLIVMAFGNSTGTDMMQPVALVCIGGLVYATLTTLYIVPAIYDIMNRENYKYISDEDLDIRYQSWR